MCIVVAIGVLEKLPDFSLMANLTIKDILDNQLDSIDIIRHVYEFATKDFSKSKI